MPTPGANQLAVKLGFWSAILAAATFVIYTLCFIGILLVSPLFMWTDMSDYVAYVQANPQFFKDTAQVAMLLFGPLFVILLNSIHELAPANQRTLTRVALSFGILFALLTSLFYFVQLSTVKQNLLLGHTDGLEHFVQANPASALLAVNMLGWTLFLGLASLFVAPVFAGGTLETVIRYAFLVNGTVCLLGGASFLLNIPILVFLFITIGMGGAVLVGTIALSLYFSRLQRQ